jgi:hypothetical protein
VHPAVHGTDNSVGSLNQRPNSNIVATKTAKKNTASHMPGFIENDN